MTDETTFQAAMAALRFAQASDVQLILYSHNWDKKKPYFCAFEKKEDGLEIKGSEAGTSPEEAIVAAWGKFEELARRGAPRLLAGLIEGPKGEDLPSCLERPKPEDEYLDSDNCPF